MKFFQEKIYKFNWCTNGAGPLWCYGSSCIAAFNEKVFISGWDCIPGVPPLNCAKWLLFERTKNGWQEIINDSERTREPSPICIFNDGRLFLSTNPAMFTEESRGSVSLPVVYEFHYPDYSKPVKTMVPHFSEPVVFVEHSYRNFAADGENCELILFHNKDYDRAYWSFFDRNGNWSHCGKLYWPWGYSYGKPQRIRLCYNNVQLKNRAVYVFGTSDILEPNMRWREFKRKLTGREWDYDFRRVFFSFTPDITKEPFRYWVEISEREKTAGYLRNCDLFVDNNEITHLLWIEKSCDERLKPVFFPEEPVTYSLYYARLKGQKIQEKKEILSFTEDTKIPSTSIKNMWSRFHITETGKIFVFCTVPWEDDRNKINAENYLIELDKTGHLKSKNKVNFDKPFISFHTANIRNGTKPSNILHIYGHISQTNDEMWYGCIDCQD